MPRFPSNPGSDTTQEGLAPSQIQTYILFSLEPEEVIFWIFSWPSSVLSSVSCLVSSSLFLDHNWPALTFPEDCDNFLVSRGFNRDA